MKVAVQLMRHRGVLVREGQRARLEGLLRTEASNIAGAVTRKLVLRSFGASPGMGALAELYDVRLVRVEWWGMVLRGLEGVASEQGTAAVLQEWSVEVGGPSVPGQPTAGSVSAAAASALVGSVA